MGFLIFWMVLMVLRLAEMGISKRNDRWLLARGAVEYGQNHYPYLVGMHVLFFACLPVEYYFSGYAAFHPWMLVVCMGLYGLRFWVIATLGRFWTTRILRIPGEPLIRKGPYRFTNHPNYLIVVIEMAAIPAVFGLYDCALLFFILNGVMLYIRIREENRALRAV